MERQSVKKSRKYFDRIADQYDTPEGLSQETQILYDYFISAVRVGNVRSILDVGCGTGELLKLLSETVPDAQLWGLDISEKMLEKAKEKEIGHAEFVLGDSARIPLETGSCDVVCCNHSFHHYPAPFKVLKEFWRVLKTGGTLMIGENYLPPVVRLMKNAELFFRRRFGDVWIYSEKEFRWMLSRYFSQVHYERVGEKYCFVYAKK